MLTHGSILVSLLWLVEQIPTPPPLAKRQRGRQETYSDKLFVKALIVMIIWRLYTAYALLSFLEQAEPVAQQIRPLLTEHGRFPTRRTWERRFATLPARLPALIGCLGRHLVTLLQPWAAQGHAAAVDSTPLRANGGVWHKNIGWPGKCRIPRLTPKRLGASRGITAGGTAGSCIWRSRSAASGSPWPRSLPSPATPTMCSPQSCWSHCQWRYAMCSETRMTTPLSCARHVRCTTGNWSPRGAARIPIGMGASKSAGSFLSYVRSLLSRSMACAKTSLHGVGRCRSKG